MIPTSASSSSPTAAAAAANCSPLNGNGCGGGGAGAAASQQSTQSLIIGIASLILEGRAIAEDEFSPQAPAAPLTSPPRAEGALRASSPNSYGRPSSTATATATITSNTSDANTFGSNGRQSPMPSTSRGGGGGGLVTVNITANPRDYVMSGAAHGSSPGGGMPPFLRLMSSAESTHQRWTQKLCQLRQQSPAGSFGAASDMPHMATTTTTAAAAGQGEYVALTINEAAASNGDVADYEIVRRVALKWPPPGTTAGGSSASSSPGSGPGSSENFLHSLQSLASTCLRGGNSTATAGPGVAASVPTTVSPRPATPPESSFGGYRYAGISAAPIVAPMPPAHSPTAKYQTWFRATPPPPRFPSPLGDDSGNSPRPSGSSGDRKLLLEASSTASIAIPSVPVSERLAAKPPRGSARLETTGRTGADKKAAAKASGATTKTTTSTSSKHPQQGPHCDQFLRKMGLAKGEAAATQEDHFCDMTYLNITCWRWRAYSARMEEILEQGEPLCIEVYLGPASHSILLEQWIITLKEKVPPPTMTLPSLCSAIRSQLCFSQISAWCDLIKKADPHSVYESGRVIVRASTGSAGDLATPGSLPLQAPDSLGASVWPAAVVAPTGQRRNSSSQCPRLHIFYRFKKYDNTACFNAKPNVHNFPNVNMSENCSISVCLKSLPRLNGGIPKVGTMSAGGSGAAAAAPKVEASVEKKQQRGSVATNKGNGKCGSQSSSSSSSRSKTSGAPRRSNCHYFIDEDDIDLDEEEEEDEEAHQNGGDEASSGSCATNGHERNGSTSSGGGLHISHREKQLLKYRKRMQRRDKSKQPGGVASNCSDQEHQPMEQSDEEEDEKANNRTTTTATTTSTARPIEMISTGTQTATTCCQQCGSEKTLVCLKCCRTGRKSRRDALLYPPPGAVDIGGMDSSSSTGSLSSADFIHVPRNQGERLLQSIQRTPKAAKKQKKAMRALMATMRVMEAEAAESFAIAVTPSPASKDATLQVAASPSDCKGCKRQKTQHDFAADATNGGSGGAGDERDSGVSVASAKSEAPRVASRAEKGEMNGAAAAAELSGGKEPEVQILESETFLTTTKLTPHIDRCSLQPDSYVERRCCTPPSVGESGGGEMTSLDVCPKTAKAQFKTPTAAANQLTLHNGAFLHQTKPQATPHKVGGGGITIITTTTTSSGALVQPGNLLSATSFLNFGGTPRLHPSSLPLRKGLPKVNLTPIFCNPSATLGATSPISITCSSADTTAAGGGTFSFDPDALDGSLEHRRSSPSIPAELAAGSVPVQKSYSAPTLPNSPSLSPRFAKQAAKQRRSRHLSDRSDRSSLGSDEQYSDEDVVGGSAGFYNAAGRSRSSHIFGYAPLIGNLEECLLKKRLVPVVEVQGFKVQLGASGGFCPTQLTFPAVSHFYELPGDTLSTPYVCEIRLPRKGYSVPRAGTIQATLLNTIGTVVRMFVIPYDMRDMPPLHQTFIRQRVLAQAGKAELSAGGEGSGAGGEGGGGGGGDADRRVNGDCSMNGGLYGGPEERNLNNNNIHKYNNNNNNNNTNVKYKLSPGGGLHSESNLGHFISTENMKRLRYSIHLRFQTSRSGRLSLHSDIRILISRRTDLDTAAAHAKGVLEAPSDLVTDTVMPSNPKYSSRQETSLSSTSSSTSSTACHSGNNNNNNIKI